MNRSTRYAVLLLASSSIIGQLSCEPPPAPPETASVESTIPVPGLTVGTRHVMNSDLLDEERELLVYLPNGYDDSPERRYPLFVVLDARASFRPMAMMIHTLSEGRAIPRMIVVGIVNSNRWRDLTPVEGMGIPGTGGGADFLASLESEVVPFIDAHWRTNDFRVFSGHSLGGLTTLNVLQGAPDLFDAHIALSPSLEWGEGFMIERHRDFLRRTPSIDKMLYLAIADEQMERPYYDEMVELLQRQAPSDLLWTSDVFEAEDDHMSIRITGGLAGIRWVFRDWRLTSRRLYAMSTEEIEHHYVEATRRYKEPRALGIMEITDAAYWGIYDPGRVDRAMELFHLAVERWPDRAYPYSCLGEGLERTGHLEAALEQMERALEMAKEQGERDIPYYQGMVNRVREALATEA